MEIPTLAQLLASSRLLTWLAFNTPETLVILAYGTPQAGPHPSYLTEKSSVIRRHGFMRWYSTLDHGSRRRLMTAALIKYTNLLRDVEEPRTAAGSLD